MKKVLLSAAAAALLVGCEAPQPETHYIRLSDAACTLDGSEGAALQVRVEANPSWEAASGASWLTAEKSDGNILVLTASANDTGYERTAVVTVTAGQAEEKVTVIQMAEQTAHNKLRYLTAFPSIGVMSPDGRYVGGYYSVLQADDSYASCTLVVDNETGEEYEYGPFPKSLMFFSDVQAISDRGELFIMDGKMGGCWIIGLDGTYSKIESVEVFDNSPKFCATGAGGAVRVGYAIKIMENGDRVECPIKWNEGVPEALPKPSPSFRELEKIGEGTGVESVMARGVSADGRIVYGTSWRNDDFGMCYWDENGEAHWVGEDVRKVREVEMAYGDGTTRRYNLVDGMTCEASYTNISSTGKYIAGTFRTEALGDDKKSVVRSYRAAFYNTETGKTTVFEELGESAGIHVTDDGIGFVGLGRLGIMSGKVVDIENGLDLGSTAEWIYDNYGIIAPEMGYVKHMSTDKRVFLAVIPVIGAGGMTFKSYFVAPLVAE